MESFSPIRCAIYTRKSTDEGLEKEFNTLEAQREAGENYIRSMKHQGWVILPEHYDDGGFSGGSLKRPALKQLLSDVEAGKVDMIVVYKIDRLTRSLLDFAQLVKIFEKHCCSFVSVTQHFNTCDSMGKLTLNSGIAKYMNVETEEIGCIAKQIRVNGTNKKGFAIELFDKNASGYCSSNDIIKNLNIIFKYAQNILKCDCAQSCNKCILQNDTKYNYRYLDRKLALEFLTDEWIAKNTLPQDMKIFGDGTLVASASIESLIEDTPNLQKLYLIIPENMENEDFSNSPIYRLVNRYNALNTQIILCVNEKTLGDDVKKTISLLSNLSNVSVKAIPEKLNDKIMAIVWDGFKYYSYASFDENVRQLNQYWGSNINTSILSGYIDINGLKFNDVKLETVENISYDKMFNISSEVNGPGYGFGNRLLSILASSLDKGISSPIVKIEYKDRYLKNPLASGLFYSFIKELKVRYEKLWNCASITLETAETTETNKQYPTMFYHDWDDVDARNEVLTALFDKIGLKFQLKEKNKKYLEHNRIMTIELENGEKINLILDQGFSYWRCLAYCYAENIFPFDADIDEQVAKIGQWLPNVSGDTYPTRIFYTKSK